MGGGSQVCPPGDLPSGVRLGVLLMFDQVACSENQGTNCSIPADFTKTNISDRFFGGLGLTQNGSGREMSLEQSHHVSSQTFRTDAD